MAADGGPIWVNDGVHKYDMNVIKKRWSPDSARGPSLQ